MRAAALLCVAVTACGGGESTSPSALVIRVTGRIERGSTIALTATRAGASVVPALVSWSASPSTIVTISSDGHALLLETGSVTFHATDNSSASAAASGSRTLLVARPPEILFDMHDTLVDSIRSGNRNIYRVALDGRELTRISSGAGDNIHPTAAPLGATIIFTSFRTGQPSLFSVQSSGGSEAALPGPPPYATDADLAPNGATVVFVATENGGTGVWTAHPDGSAAAQVPGTSPSAIVAHPTWCKGGDSVVVVTTAFSNAALYVQSASSGQGRMLTSGATFDVEPSCGPDGRSVVFASNRDGDVGLFVSSGESGAESVHRVGPHPGNVGQPTWLADGRIVFVDANGTDSARLAWIDPAAGDSVTSIALSGHGAPANPTTAPTRSH